MKQPHNYQIMIYRPTLYILTPELSYSTSEHAVTAFGSVDMVEEYISYRV